MHERPESSELYIEIGGINLQGGPQFRRLLYNLRIRKSHKLLVEWQWESMPAVRETQPGRSDRGVEFLNPNWNSACGGNHAPHSLGLGLARRMGVRNYPQASKDRLPNECK